MRVRCIKEFWINEEDGDDDRVCIEVGSEWEVAEESFMSDIRLVQYGENKFNWLEMYEETFRACFEEVEE